MARQIKVARGSRFICKCGCGQRKTNPKRWFAPGHSYQFTARRRARGFGRPAPEEKSVPKILNERAKRDAKRGIIPGKE